MAVCKSKSCIGEKIFLVYMDYYIDANGVFRRNTGSRKISLIDKEKVEGKRCFSDYDLRDEVILPEEVETIGKYAFYECGKGFDNFRQVRYYMYIGVLWGIQ